MSEDEDLEFTAVHSATVRMGKELNRLRAENERLRKQVSKTNVEVRSEELDRLNDELMASAQRNLDLRVENDRLRAELAELKDALEESKQYVIWHREAIAEGLMYLRKADDLRAENAELRRVATDLRNECYFMGKDVSEADAILLAKTAKEAE